MNEQIIYLNGKFVPIDQAFVSVLDRGFLFADGIYEVIPVYNNKLFRLDEHLKRLRRSLSELAIPSPCTDQEYAMLFSDLLKKNSHYGPYQVIYLQITRGADVKRHHNIPDQLNPTLYIQSTKLPNHEFATVKLGKRAVVLDDLRWGRCDIKSISLLANVLLNDQARRQECEEAILIRDGMLTEGASSNVLIVKNGTIKTPPLSQYILGGITRDVIIELAKQHNIPLLQTTISREELYTADEVWISSSTREIFPIVSLDNKPVGNGVAGPVWEAMIAYFHEFIASL